MKMGKTLKNVKFSPAVEEDAVPPDAVVADDDTAVTDVVAGVQEEAFFSALETSSFSQLSSIRFLGGGDLLEPPFVTTSSFFLFLSAVVCLTEAFVVFKFELVCCPEERLVAALPATFVLPLLLSI